MSRIKFCGLRRKEDVALVNEIRPDYAGFILCRRFRRFAEDFKDIRPLLSPDIPAVGVFVDDGFGEIEGYLDLLDYVQLHGNESEELIERLQDCGKKVIKAFKVTSERDLENAYRSPADLVLLDSGTGTGERFDWRLIEGFGRDYILAGGLCPENAAEAVKRLHPFALDVSSGIETDRVKDGEKMRRFAAAVRLPSIQ